MISGVYQYFSCLICHCCGSNLYVIFHIFQTPINHFSLLLLSLFQCTPNYFCVFCLGSKTKFFSFIHLVLCMTYSYCQLIYYVDILPFLYFLYTITFFQQCAVFIKILISFNIFQFIYFHIQVNFGELIFILSSNFFFIFHTSLKFLKISGGFRDIKILL